MPWPQVLVDGQSTLRFAAVCTPPSPAVWTRENGRYRGNDCRSRKTRDCGRRATHFVSDEEGYSMSTHDKQTLAQSSAGVVGSRLAAHRSRYGGGRQRGLARPASIRAREAAIDYRADGFRGRALRRPPSASSRRRVDSEIASFDGKRCFGILGKLSCPHGPSSYEAHARTEQRSEQRSDDERHSCLPKQLYPC